MGQCVSKKPAEKDREAGPALGEIDQEPGTADPAEKQFEEIRKKIDAKLREDAQTSKDVKDGVALVQRVTPIVLEYVGEVLQEVGETHWTLTALKFVGTAMKMWTVATKNQEQNIELYRKLKEFHDTLGRSAVRNFSAKVKEDAAGVALKGYALVSLIAHRDPLLRVGLSGIDDKSLQGFGKEVEQTHTALAYEGVFVILDTLDKQGEMKMAKYQIQLEKEYATLQRHLNTIYSFRDQHTNPPYYLMWMEGRKNKTIEMQGIDEARRALNAYWKAVKESYELGMLPLPYNEFLNGHMLRRAVDYRSLVEPLDCANWYYIGIDKEELQPGIFKGDYVSAQQRPGAYTLICRRQQAAGTFDIQPTAEVWEERLKEISARCKEARDNRSSSQED